MHFGSHAGSSGVAGAGGGSRCMPATRASSSMGACSYSTPLRTAPSRIAPVKSAPSIFAPVSLMFVRFAPLSFASRRSAYERFALVKSAFRSFEPFRKARCKSFLENTEPLSRSASSRWAHPRCASVSSVFPHVELARFACRRSTPCKDAVAEPREIDVLPGDTIKFGQCEVDVGQFLAIPCRKPRVNFLGVENALGFVPRELEKSRLVLEPLIQVILRVHSVGFRLRVADGKGC